VSQSQNVIWSSKTEPGPPRDGVERDPHRRQDAADLDDETSPGSSHRPRVELDEGIDDGPANDTWIQIDWTSRVREWTLEHLPVRHQQVLDEIGSEAEGRENVARRRWTMTPTSSAENNGVVTGTCRATGGIRFLRPRLPQSPASG